MRKFQVNTLKEDAKELQVLYLEPYADKKETFCNWLKKYFKQVTITKSADDALELFENGFFDIIITNMQITDMEITVFCSKIRAITRNKPIILVSHKEDTKTLISLVNMGISGYLACPFNKIEAIKVLSEVVNAIVDTKMMFKHQDSYIEMLENMINPQALSCKVEEQPKPEETSNVDKDTINKIRFNQPNKMSAADFMQQLDNTIVDKIESFSEELDAFALVIYDIEELDHKAAYLKLGDIINTLHEFISIVDSMVLFPIISDTFSGLIEFLNSFEAENLKDENKKNLLIESLLGLEKDLKVWIKTIFIEQNTNDIHYFDASFANNCLEIKSLFLETAPALDDDEDDLEFF